MRPLSSGSEKATAARRDRGFTLLEVLVAAVILGVGLLAMGIAELTSSGSNRTSREISLATAFGEEILERIRRNQAELASYDGFDTGDPSTRPGAAGVLQTDYDQWKARVEAPSPNGLPGGRGTVDVATATPIAGANQVTATITWSGVPARTITVQTVIFE